MRRSDALRSAWPSRLSTGGSRGCQRSVRFGYFLRMAETWVRRLSVGVASLGCLAGVLVGCSDDPPEAQPTQSASAESPTRDSEPSATSSSAEPTAPALPAAAKEDSKAGAKAFVAWYLRSLAHAANTGDVRNLKALSPGCAGCRDYISLYKNVYSRGGFFRDVKWTPVTWSITSQSPRTNRVLVAIRAAEARYKASADEDVMVNGKYDDAFVFELTRRMSQWTVSELASGTA